MFRATIAVAALMAAAVLAAPTTHADPPAQGHGRWCEQTSGPHGFMDLDDCLDASQSMFQRDIAAAEDAYDDDVADCAATYSETKPYNQCVADAKRARDNRIDDAQGDKSSRDRDCYSWFPDE